jgi:hypothetical protein
MRLTPSDPDVETLIGRIDAKDIDLQPNFQRGEVWSVAKKQRLIDSILRDWHIPPIHVIVDPVTNKQAVLDGQQRLVAIRDFAQNLFAIDGSVPPIDKEISRLDGKRFKDLPPEWRARFHQFTIRIFRITNYEASEPAELFFRLNQPTALTSAEKRNAYFGSTRDQVRSVVQKMQEAGLDKSFWGFSDARMAYDDIVARACLTIENKSLRKKVTSNALADRYRAAIAFPDEVISVVDAAVDTLAKCRSSRLHSRSLDFNKAVTESCLIFVSQLVTQFRDEADRVSVLSEFLRDFSNLDLDWMISSDAPLITLLIEMYSPEFLDALVQAYRDRSTSRVSDTTSVIVRDFVFWAAFSALAVQRGHSHIRKVAHIVQWQHELKLVRKKEDLEKWVDGASWDLG